MKGFGVGLVIRQMSDGEIVHEEPLMKLNDRESAEKMLSVAMAIIGVLQSFAQSFDLEEEEPAELEPLWDINKGQVN